MVVVLIGTAVVLAANFAEVVDGGLEVGAAVVVVVVVVAGDGTSSIGAGLFRMEGATSLLKMGAIAGLLVVGSGCWSLIGAVVSGRTLLVDGRKSKNRTHRAQV